MQFFKKKALSAWFAIALVFFVASCSAPKDVTYMQDLQPGTYQMEQIEKALRARPDDRLSILITSKDPQLSKIFNLNYYSSNTSSNLQSGTSAGRSLSQTYTLLYTVNAQGNVEIPVLGSVHVQGLTRTEIEQKVKSELIAKDLLKDPTVVVEFANQTFSVLGEVAQPGRKVFDRDNITLLEGIALAGDLSMTGKRTNVMVIREDGIGQRQVYVIDLTNAQSLYSSPAYYLKQGDVIYVDAIDTRKRQRDANANTFMTAGFWMSLASVLMSLSVLIFK